MAASFAAARSGINGIGSWLKGNNSKKKEILDTEPEVIQDGKRKHGWYEVSATAACEDVLLIGFGNGALVCLDTKINVKKDS